VLPNARAEAVSSYVCWKTPYLKTGRVYNTGWHSTRKKPVPLFEAALGRTGGAGMAAASSDGALLGQRRKASCWGRGGERLSPALP